MRERIEALKWVCDVCGAREWALDTPEGWESRQDGRDLCGDCLERMYARGEIRCEYEWDATYRCTKCVVTARDAAAVPACPSEEFKAKLKALHDGLEADRAAAPVAAEPKKFTDYDDWLAAVRRESEKLKISDVEAEFQRAEPEKKVNFREFL